MPRPLALLLYNLLYPLALLLMAPAAWKKMRIRGGKAGDFWQRSGFFSIEICKRIEQLHAGATDGLFWIHAVSVGEVGIAAKLIRVLRTLRPGFGFVLTSTTPTGCALARKCAAENDGAVLALYSALDGWFAVRRFLRAIRPAKLVLVEAEVWPNLVTAAAHRGIPVTLVNARLSARSERRFRAFRFLAQPFFSLLHRVCVQEPEDVTRFVETFGIAADRVTCTGSIKFDREGEVEPLEQVAEFRRMVAALGWEPADRILVAASTHAGEEVEIARLFTRLQVQFPDLRLIIVPRHVERSSQIEDDVSTQTGLSLMRRSRIDRVPRVSCLAPHAVLLVDTTGELRAWQHLATVVVIGKSFLACGGQNPAEAAMARKPVVFGPHMENFEALVRLLLARKGAVQVSDWGALERELEWLLRDRGAAQAIGHEGYVALKAHEGATQRTAACLLA